jgi:UDP-sulfoquinovose synthase
VRIFNQMTETHRLIELARLVSRLTGTPIHHVENPRNEADENELRAVNRHLLDLGLQPITLEDGLLREVTEVARRYAHRCDRDKIPSRPRWTEPPATAPAPSADGRPDRGDADVDAVPAAAKS